MSSLPSAAAARYRRHVLVNEIPSSPSDLSPPALWLQSAAVAIIAFWLVALTAEALLAESKSYLVATETSSSLFACLGAVTLITAAAVVYFTFQPSNNRFSIKFC